MKPHRLRFAGIGAYPGLVEIDFDDLGELGLYLVVGPTGAGKTTIFDAITFALYGELAGARSKATLVSDHTHRQPPFVELDFSHRGAHYRLHRTPPVAGKSAKTNDVWIAEYADEHYGEPPASTVTGATNVTERVESIIGLDADQFMRVMLLPQNEFQQFLLANSTKKEELLRALFGTTLYERIAIELTESAKRLGIEARRAAEKIDEIRASIRGQVDTVINEGLGDTLPDPDADLPGLVVHLRELHAAAVVVASDASTRATAATSARATAVAEAARFDAALELAELEALDRAEAAQVAHAAQQLDADERARRVMQVVATRDIAHLTHEAAARRVAADRAELVAVLTAAPDDVPVLRELRRLAPDAAPAALAAEVATARANVDRAVTAFNAATQADRSAVGHEQAAVEAAGTADELRARITECGHTIESVSARLEAARVLAESLPELDRQVSALDDLLARADVSGATAALLDAQTGYDLAEAARRVLDDEVAAARRARTLHLAGELAAQLAPGAACPVCGSAEHPAPAPPAEGADTSEVDERRTAAMVAEAAAAATLEAAQARKELVDSLAAELPAPDDQQALRERHAAADAARATRAQLDTELTTAREALTTLTADLTAADAKAEQELGHAERLRRDAHEQRAAANEVIDQAVAEVVAQALVDADHFIAGLSTAVSEFEAASGARHAADQQLVTTLQTEQFADEATATAAVLDEPLRTSLDGLVQAAARRTTRIVHCRAVVGETPPPAERPDIEGLEAAERDALAASQRATSDVTTLGNAATSVEQSTQQLDTLAPDVERQRARAQRAEHLAKVMKNGSGDSLGIERWVQRTVFEEVCDVASVQLRTLSAGRYVLTLEASGSPTRKATAGLDLFVTDSHTGSTRAVGTLSGGEQFLTSLALALALAEVVQRRSGGIELATLFIDEGFGSLDGETLDTAVEVLRSLQDTGRTVGVISHVDAMQQELRIGIRVTPSPSGSRVAVHPDIT